MVVSTLIIVEKATYRIVNMSGATIANGTVSGDNAYIFNLFFGKRCICDCGNGKWC